MSDINFTHLRRLDFEMEHLVYDKTSGFPENYSRDSCQGLKALQDLESRGWKWSMKTDEAKYVVTLLPAPNFYSLISYKAVEDTLAKAICVAIVRALTENHYWVLEES